MKKKKKEKEKRKKRMRKEPRFFFYFNPCTMHLFFTLCSESRTLQPHLMPVCKVLNVSIN